MRALPPTAQRSHWLVAGTLSLGLLAPGGAGCLAATDLNEVAALLVYPAVIALDESGSTWETYLSVIHAGSGDVTAHVAYVNGDGDAYDYCSECNFGFPLTGNDTELLVVRHTAFGVTIEAEDGTVSQACPHRFGMVTLHVEDPGGAVRTDNVLLGQQVVINYSAGYAYSIPAVTIQGRNGGDGDRELELDGAEFARLPRVIAADFIAPDLNGPLGAELVLFTLGFDAGHPPVVDCDVIGYDASEHPFSRSFVTGCWMFGDLCAIHPEFCYPNLGQLACTPGVDCDTHGWLALNCRVDQDADGTFDGNGGVHGALIQVGSAGAGVRRNDPTAPQMSQTAAWARLMHQSVTTGGAVTYRLAGPGGSL